MTSDSSNSVHEDPEIVREFIQEYFDAWKGSSEREILSYYSEDVVLRIPFGTLGGKATVRDRFVRPFIEGFPGNVHVPLNLAHAPNMVAVEWIFEATHAGCFAGFQATGGQVRVRGCSFYEYDLGKRWITGGRIYFDLGTLMRQVGAV